MMTRKLLGAALAAITVAGLLAGCGGASAPSSGTNTPAGSGSGDKPGTVLGISGPTITKIQKRGKLLVGGKHDVPKFGFKDPATGKVEGMEIDIAKALAKVIVGDENKIDVQHVSASTRIGLLNNDEIDFILATMTVTEKRKEEVDFSPLYYTDGIKMVADKNGPIKSVKDMGGKTLAVNKGSTSKDRMAEAAKKAGVDMKEAEYQTYPEMKAALLAGKVQAMASDGAIMAGYTDDKNILLPERYSEEPYAIATKKGNDDLRQVIEKVVNDLIKSGELKKIQDKWGLGGSN